MIPNFDKSGNLPLGIHETTLEEFEKKFAYTIIRKKQFDNLLKIIDELKRFNCRIIYIDGSYVTNKRIPRDIDICWEDRLSDGQELYQFAEMMAPILFKTKEEQQKKYNADILPAHFKTVDSKIFFIDHFQKDKYTDLPKGIIKIQIG